MEGSLKTGLKHQYVDKQEWWLLTAKENKVDGNLKTSLKKKKQLQVS